MGAALAIILGVIFIPMVGIHLAVRSMEPEERVVSSNGVNGPASRCC